MKVTTITARAGRTFNHPYEQFSNFRPEVEMTASLDAGDDVSLCMRHLQEQAEQLAEAQKDQILRDLRIVETRERLERERKRLTHDVDSNKNRLERIDEELKLLGQPTSVSPSAPDDLLSHDAIDDDLPY